MDNVTIVTALLKAFGDKQELLAKELGVSQPTVSRWIAGGTLAGENRDKVYSLAIEKGIINQDPLSPNRKSTTSEKDPNMIAEIHLTGGLGGGGVAIVDSTGNKHGMTFAKEVVRDYWRLPDWLLSRLNLKARSMAAFPVQGDSMEPTLRDGDVIFIDTSHRVPSPPGIYALADEFGGIVVKRLEVTSRPNDDDVTILISSDNPRHGPRERTLSEVAIVGRYVGRFTT